MPASLKWLFLCSMTLALACGFAQPLAPPDFSYRFERLHIFLFNLCSGGTIILYYTEGRAIPSVRVIAFFILSVAYAFCAFFELYLPAIIIAPLLAVIVEAVRIRRFSFFPTDFFRPDVSAAEKFQQAALLCLSLGLIVSALVVINHRYLPLISSPKLVLDVFFLGFSFPVSLVTMSVMFSLMKKSGGWTEALLRDAAFWIVNLGVIVFFIFIIFELASPQLAAAGLLFAAVVAIFLQYLRAGRPEQQKNFLASGMLFLILTAVTGIGYLLAKFFLGDGYYEHWGGRLLLLHAFISLYGWNLSGLVVICRLDDFPIKLNSRSALTLHWVTVLLLAPLGKGYPAAAIAAVGCYFIFLYLVFFSLSGQKPDSAYNKANRDSRYSNTDLPI